VSTQVKSRIHARKFWCYENDGRHTIKTDNDLETFLIFKHLLIVIF